MGKTPFQRHREEEEKRKKREEEEAAKLYEDFVESFGDKDEETGKSFVQGEVIQPGSAQSSGSLGGPVKKSSRYVPSFLPPSMASTFGKEEKAGQRINEPVHPTPPSRGKTKHIDSLLETMKRDQDARSERQRVRREKGSSFELGSAIDDGMGSFDDGDPYTTNLYVGNLASTVDEEVLKQEFLRYGDIASIKVMWPRDDDQRRRGRNCGFVAFMTRLGAERAKDELNGIVLHDLDLKIGWGKAVVLPPIPVYTQSGKGGLAPMLAAAKAKAASAYAATPGLVAPAPWQAPPPVQDADPHAGAGPNIAVVAPEDMRARFIIDSVATYVMVDGCPFEQALMSREANNPEFMFLFDLACPEHAYYRWRLYSLAQGDSLRNWRNEPFVMVEGGPRWIPPSMTAMTHGKEQTAAQRGGEAKDKDKPLSDLQRDRFEDLLRALTMERGRICEAMVFAVDNAESASEVVEILSDSLTLSETPLTTKVARLMLASDVLHNSTAPVRNASRYRNLLEASLPDIFESLQETYRSSESRMHQEVLRRNVLRVLRIWRSWFIFSDDFLNGLKATFLKGKSVNAQNPALREELELLEPDALALRCRRNGVSREGGSDPQIQRLINLQAYLSGDLENEPASAKAAPEAIPAEALQSSHGVFAVNAQPAEIKQIKQDDPPVLGPVVKAEEAEAKPEVKKELKKPTDEPVSKWTMVDYDQEDSAFPGVIDEEEDKIFSDLEKTPVVESGKALAPTLLSEPDGPAISKDPMEENDPPETRGGGERIDAAEEGRRARLRQVEVELLLFREKLEDKGISKSDIDKKVDEERERLLLQHSHRSSNSADEPSTSNRDTEKADVAKKGSSHRSKTSKESSRRYGSKSPQPNSRDKKSDRKESSKVKERDKDKDRDKNKDREKAKDKAASKDSSRSSHALKYDTPRRHSPSRKDRRRSRSRSRSRERSRDRRRSLSGSPRRSQSRDKERKQSPARSQHKNQDNLKEHSMRGRDKDRSSVRDESPLRSKKRGRSKSKERETQSSRRDTGSKKDERTERSRSPKKTRSSHASRK